MPLDPDQLRWHEAWQCVRALAEVGDNRLASNHNNVNHPFETSVEGVSRHLQLTTGIQVELPPRNAHI